MQIDAVRAAAIAGNESEVAQWIMATGRRDGSWPRVNATFQYDHGSAEDVTLLMIAADNGHFTLVKTLLSRGADVNLQDGKDQSALLYAVRTGQEILATGDDSRRRSYNQIVDKLLGWGANPDLQDYKGNTPLMQAAMGGDTCMVRALLRHDAKIDLKNHQGDFAIKLAAEAEHNPHADVVKMLSDEREKRHKQKQRLGSPRKLTFTPGAGPSSASSTPPDHGQGTPPEVQSASSPEGASWSSPEGVHEPRRSERLLRKRKCEAVSQSDDRAVISQVEWYGEATAEQEDPALGSGQSSRAA